MRLAQKSQSERFAGSIHFASSAIQQRYSAPKRQMLLGGCSFVVKASKGQTKVSMEELEAWVTGLKK